MRTFAFLLLGALAIGCTDGTDGGSLTSADESIVGDESGVNGELTVGTALRTTANLNLREGASKKFDVIVVMPRGSTVKIREAKPVNGFHAVTYADQEGWAYGAYLSAEGSVGDGDGKAPPEPSDPAAKVRINGPAVRAHVQEFANASCAAVGGCKFTVGTYSGHQPASDRAIDMMQCAHGTRPNAENKERGTKIANFGIANGAAHRVDYVIWEQKINSLDGRGWRMMGDRGSITQNHYDHVHVSFEP